MRALRQPAALLAAVLLTAGAGCGGDSDDGVAQERGDAPVRPPAGWRTVGNAAAGFTLAAPRRWAARTKGEATLIRSPGRLVAMTVAADRSRAGRTLEPARYARTTLEGLPGFEGSVSASPRRVRGTPYRAARVDGLGSVRTSRIPQRITVAAYHREGEATYAAVVFRNATARSRSDERTIGRMLRTFRAGAR